MTEQKTGGVGDGNAFNSSESTKSVAAFDVATQTRTEANDLETTFRGIKKVVRSEKQPEVSSKNRRKKQTTSKLGGESPTGRRVGRPKGSGKYGEPTQAIRMPISLKDRVAAFISRNGLVVRLYEDRIQAGFPSPALDAPYEELDLTHFLIPNPASTFFIRATGDSMRDAGIFSNDVLIVDRSLEPSNGDVVLAAINGEFTVKRLFKKDDVVELRPENPRYPVLKIDEEMDFIVWGVVKKVIHDV